MHVVAVVAFDGVDLFDFATPCETFRRVRLPDGSAAYEVRVCATKPQIDAGHFAIGAERGLAALSEADTVIVPGLAQPDGPPPPELVAAVRAAAERGARIVSIGTGAFLLTEARLPDGSRETTHPLTALEVCLYLVRRDHGAAVAADLARCFVTPLEREGERPRLVAPEPAVAHRASLQPVLRWAEEHLEENLSNKTLARRAIMSPRTLARRFHQQIGTTPASWVASARIRRARELLESTDLPVARVGEAVGFGSPATFRARFREAVGMSPQRYRRAFLAPPPAGSLPMR